MQARKIQTITFYLFAYKQMNTEWFLVMKCQPNLAFHHFRLSLAIICFLTLARFYMLWNFNDMHVKYSAGFLSFQTTHGDVTLIFIHILSFGNGNEQWCEKHNIYWHSYAGGLKRQLLCAFLDKYKIITLSCLSSKMLQYSVLNNKLDWHIN